MSPGSSLPARVLVGEWGSVDIGDIGAAEGSGSRFSGELTD